MNKVKDLSLASRSLRYKLRIAFYLTLVLPLLISLYLISNYILPQIGFKTHIAVLVIVDIAIAVGGFLVIREVINRVVSMSSEARLIANGNLEHHIAVSCEDEVGDLGGTLNQLTKRIRDNMEELKSYSEKTTEINLEIQRRVIVLSSLLQISSLISQGAKLDDILKITVERSHQIADSDVAYLLFRETGADTLMMKMAEGINSQYLLKIRIDIGKSIFNSAIKSHSALILDEHNPVPPNLRVQFYEEFKLRNTVALPIYCRGELLGILGIGNTREKFSYKKDSLELIDIFAKQIAIAVENDILMHRVEKLEIKDTLTGLYNVAFIQGRLQEEIKRAVTYQRPCAFIILNIDNFKKYREAFGALAGEATLKKVATLIKDSVSDIDRVARFGDNDFAVLLPEKNKRQAAEIAEGMRKKIEFSFSEEADVSKRITVSGGVSENPLDGIGADEIIKKASDCLALAKTKGKNIVVK